MKFAEITGRLTGLACPVFGVSHNPSPDEVSQARRVIAFLQNCWVLFGPSEGEIPEHCVDSVVAIRGFLSTELNRFRQTGELWATLKAMRAACSKFLDTVEHTGTTIIPFAAIPNHYATWVFNGALGEFRGVFGVHIVRLAAQHGLDVEDALAIILPGLDRT